MHLGGVDASTVVLFTDPPNEVSEIDKSKMSYELNESEVSLH